VPVPPVRDQNHDSFLLFFPDNMPPDHVIMPPELILPCLFLIIIYPPVSMHLDIPGSDDPVHGFSSAFRLCNKGLYLSVKIAQLEHDHPSF
jgi:hypothetical protein